MNKKPLKKNINLILNLLGDEPNNEELWLIGEIWRVGRSSNFTVNPKNTTTSTRTVQVPSSQTVLLQMKAIGRTIRIKSKSSVEEVNLEEISVKLEEICNFENDPIQSDLEQGTGAVSVDFDANESITEGIHYVLQGKSEKNPLLREKAIKAVKSVNPSKSEIVIHELPRDILRKFLYDPSKPLSNNGKSNEEYREQLTKLSQLLQNKLAGKTVILFNHKDQQIDMYYK